MDRYGGIYRLKKSRTELAARHKQGETIRKNSREFTSARVAETQDEINAKIHALPSIFPVSDKIREMHGIHG